MRHGKQSSVTSSTTLENPFLILAVPHVLPTATDAELSENYAGTGDHPISPLRSTYQVSVHGKLAKLRVQQATDAVSRSVNPSYHLVPFKHDFVGLRSISAESGDIQFGQMKLQWNSENDQVVNM